MNLAIPEPLAKLPIPQDWSLEVLSMVSEIESLDALAQGQRNVSALVASLNGRGEEKREATRGQRFIEVRLGELCGPLPGSGGSGRGQGRKKSNSQREFD